MSDSRKNNDGSLQPSTQGTLTPLPPLPVPRFPRLHDLVDPVTFELYDQSEQLPPAKPAGLFSALLQDHVELLADDVLSHRDRYTPDVVKLVEDVLQTRKSIKSLTESERELLDRATLDFATFIPPKEAPQPVRRRASTRAAAEPDPIPVHGVDTPLEAEAPAYWWLR